MNQDSNIVNNREPEGGLIASASDRNNAAPNSNSLKKGGLELRSQSPLIAGEGRFAVKGAQLPRSSSNGIAPSNIEEVIVREAYKEDNLIVIKWDSETSNILGFRVVYRLFGKPEFKQGPPLGPSEREFRIKNVPANVCIANIKSRTLVKIQILFLVGSVLIQLMECKWQRRLNDRYGFAHLVSLTIYFKLDGHNHISKCSSR